MAQKTAETVLVVEDEALIRLVIAEDLRDAGFRVLEAGDADEAIRLLEADLSIRLVFTDIDMPGSMDGLRLSALVRDRWPPIHIIVTSGKANPAAASLPPGTPFVPKPYTPAGVLNIVRSMFA